MFTPRQRKTNIAGWIICITIIVFFILCILSISKANAWGTVPDITDKLAETAVNPDWMRYTNYNKRIFTGYTTKWEMEVTEYNHTKMIQSTPPPILDKSVERQNLKRRLLRFNDENKISYIYLIDRGKIITFFPIKGKVSSVNSKLTTQTQMVETPWNGTHIIPVESPSLDGSYGTNGDAVFFFTADTDTYVEWNGTYMLCDQMLPLHTEPDILYMTVENATEFNKQNTK